MTVDQLVEYNASKDKYKRLVSFMKEFLDGVKQECPSVVVRDSDTNPNKIYLMDVVSINPFLIIEKDPSNYCYKFSLYKSVIDENFGTQIGYSIMSVSNVLNELLNLDVVKINFPIISEQLINCLKNYVE